MEVEYIATAYEKNQFPKINMPEIAFVGRSNVGKSSLLNTLINRKKTAHVSNTPGKTRTINFFSIDNKQVFVDLPGYGFAKVSQSIKKHWKTLIESYILNRENLKLVVVIVDIRHKPTKDDFIMKQWLDEYGINNVVVATKSDKLSRNQRNKNIKIINNELNTESIIFSSSTGEGKKELWSKVVKEINI